MKANTLQTLEEYGFNVPYFIIIDINSIEKIKDLDENKKYAVRSNCDIEDNEKKSHAGEFKTLLNIKKKDLEKAIYEVKSSYKGKNGTVIIQEMIDADISGVMFTANPIGILNEIVIVYGRGLGFNIVDDKILSNTIYYNRDDKSYYEDKKDINLEIEFDIIDQLINTGLKIEKKFKGKACDIEYAVKNNKVYILQSRPITTLDMNKEKIILDNSNIIESYPGVSLELTQSFAKEIYSDIFKSLVYRLTEDKELIESIHDIFDNMLGFYNGRIYYNISNWYTILKLLPCSNKLVQIWQKMLGVENKLVSDKNIKVSYKIKLNIIKNFIRLLHNTPIEMAKLNKYFKKNIEKYRYLVNKTDSTKELIKVYAYIKKDLISKWDITLANDMYTFIYTYLVNDNKKIANMKGLESEKPLRALERLSKYKVNSREYENLKEEFINKYGDRCGEELKLETHTYRTNPELLDALIKTRQRTEKRKVYTVRETNRGYIVKKAQIGIKNREISRLNRSRIFGITREIMLKIGSIYEKQGYLEEKQDIFYLNISEIKQEQDYKDLVAQRKVEYENYKKISTPNRIVFLEKIINKPVNKTNKLLIKDRTILYGESISTGKVRAEVIVIKDLKDAFNIDVKGKIIVTESTDPGWVYLIEKCAGIIVEKGSLLSHTAIISRELNKPAVVGVKDARYVLRTGDIVKLDAYKGVIELIKDK